MIHGDCSSRGCYAMTDEQIAEIYALARESFFGGQSSFQIQAFPFRMTPQNMARHRNSPHLAFWKMLKTGYDHFEVTRQEPKVDVCDRRYVFNTETNGRYISTAACPAMTTPDDVLAAVRSKQQRDEAQVADLIRRGANLPAVRSFADGGMHPTFAAAVQSHHVDEDGVVRSAGFDLRRNDPGQHPHPAERRTRAGVARDPARPRPAASPSRWSRTDTAPPQSSSSAAASSATCSRRAAASHRPAASRRSSGGGVMDRMARMVGLGGSSSCARRRRRRRRPSPRRRRPQGEGRRQEEAGQADRERRPGRHPPEERARRAADRVTQPPASSPGVINGAQPTVPTGASTTASAPGADQRHIFRLATRVAVSLTLAYGLLRSSPAQRRSRIVASYSFSVVLEPQDRRAASLCWSRRAGSRHRTGRASRQALVNADEAIRAILRIEART